MGDLQVQCCSICQETKSFSHFYLDRGRPRKECKICFRTKQDPAKKLRNQQRYYDKHRAERLEYNHNYYELNKESLKNYQKIYKKHNPEKVKALQRKTHHARKLKDPIYRIKRALRARVSMAVKNKAKKAARTMELVGCPIAFLLQHIESQFQSGMSWDNYGEWHIDHIKPCASFDLSDPAQQRECFHYTNLQPLWAKDNLAKSNNY